MRRSQPGHEREQRPASENRGLERAAAACRRNYRQRNIVGIGIGVKLTAGALSDPLCVQFYVRRKRKHPTRPLPHFVYARRRDGGVDRKRRFPTDVIELGRPRFACRGGSAVEAVGELGTITLIVESRGGAEPARYLITCAHVLGDLQSSPPVDAKLRSTCCPSIGPFATTLASSVARRGSVDYDVALAVISSPCAAASVPHTIAPDTVVRDLLPADQILPGMTLECAFPVSNVVSARVVSRRISLPLRLGRRELQVKHLYLLHAAPQPGDSGGPLRTGASLAGILVGMAGGFGLFQPFAEAFAHLQPISPLPISLFEPASQEAIGGTG